MLSIPISAATFWIYGSLHILICRWIPNGLYWQSEWVRVTKKFIGFMITKPNLPNATRSLCLRGYSLLGSGLTIFWVVRLLLLVDNDKSVFFNDDGMLLRNRIVDDCEVIIWSSADTVPSFFNDGIRIMKKKDVLMVLDSSKLPSSLLWKRNVGLYSWIIFLPFLLDTSPDQQRRSLKGE